MLESIPPSFKKKGEFKLWRNDLKILKSKMLESILSEIINPSTKNLIVGCAYHHPCIELSKI